MDTCPAKSSTNDPTNPCDEYAPAEFVTTSLRICVSGTLPSCDGLTRLVQTGGGGSSRWGDQTHNPTLVHRTELQLP
jgi:hypothetical protein